MLVHSPCHILEDLRNLQSRVRNIVRAILVKCASGGNKCVVCVCDGIFVLESCI